MSKDEVKTTEHRVPTIDEIHKALQETEARLIAMLDESVPAGTGIPEEQKKKR